MELETNQFLARLTCCAEQSQRCCANFQLVPFFSKIIMPTSVYTNDDLRVNDSNISSCYHGNCISSNFPAALQCRTTSSEESASSLKTRILPNMGQETTSSEGCVSTDQGPGNTSSEEGSVSLPTMMAGQTRSTQIHGDKLHAKSSRRYLSSMLCRRKPSPHPPHPRKQEPQVRRGSLFEKLCHQGVPEDVACRRQDLYNQLLGAVHVGYYDYDDDERTNIECGAQDSV
jgi:hypothetical protein